MTVRRGGSDKLSGVGAALYTHPSVLGRAVRFLPPYYGVKPHRAAFHALYRS
jgi:hypothetical protein